MTFVITCFKWKLNLFTDSNGEDNDWFEKVHVNCILKKPNENVKGAQIYTDYSVPSYLPCSPVPTAILAFIYFDSFYNE